MPCGDPMLQSKFLGWGRWAEQNAPEVCLDHRFVLAILKILRQIAFLGNDDREVVNARSCPDNLAFVAVLRLPLPHLTEQLPLV